MELMRTDFKDTWVKARSSVLGFLIVLILLGTFIIDTGLADGVAAWAPYSIAIVLALLWEGARTIASVTATALVLTLIGSWIGPLGDLQTGTMNRAIGVVTITCLGLACLYVDRARRRLHQSRDALAASEQQLHSFVDDMHSVGIVLCDLRGRVTEWNHGAQLLTGYTSDEIKGRPLYRVFPGKMNPVAHWGQICRWARHKGEMTREEVLQRQDGSWCVMQMMVKPLKNRFRRHHGYSLVMKNLSKSFSTTNRGVVSYRCRFEPQRTLDSIDADIAQLFDDSTNKVSSSPGQALGDWMHPLDRERAWNAVEEAVRAQRSYVLVYRLVDAGGKDKWIRDEGKAFMSADGRVAGLEGFLAGI